MRGDAYDARMETTIALTLTFDTDEALDELERVLLKARATELSEVRRRNVRLTAGYGDATTRDVMDDEARLAPGALRRLVDAPRRDQPGRAGRSNTPS